MPRILIGPMLRHVAESAATVWLEVDRPCEVRVAGRRARTFSACGHHYAIAVVDGLEPGVALEYDVTLDGERAWPEPGSPYPPSVIRPHAAGERLRMVFGSCRVAVPHEPPYTLGKDEDPRGREIDALRALAGRMREHDPADWPDLLLMLGDQVYVDEDAPETRAFIRGRRDTSRPPGDEVLDYAEYARLYRETWASDAQLRWLFSTVPTAMIFDDHDVHDDWNTSAAWLADMERTPWWHTRIVAALSSYWVYQHLGNLSPAEVEADELLRVCEREPDAGELLHEFAAEWDHERNGSRWSHARRIGRTKLIVLDSREGRVLDEGDRRMFDDAEWEWVRREAAGDHDHVVLADTLPMLMPLAFHYVEAWNEAVCAGAWGRLGARLAGERVRRALDLEHWSAFGHGFGRLTRLVEELAAGRLGGTPATVTLVGGDIHHAYLAEVALRRDAGARAAVHQVVCSPFRNPLKRSERTVALAGSSRAFVPLARLLARSAGVGDPPLRWRVAQRPTFDNQFASLTFEGRHAAVGIERVSAGPDGETRIEHSLRRPLA